MALKTPPLLVVDDDPAICELCREALELHGYTVQIASNGTLAKELLETTSFSLVLSDIMMPDTNGLELLGYIRKEHPDTFVILFTGHASIDLAKEAIRQGAFDFITKPFGVPDLIRTVDRGIEVRRRDISDLPDTELKALHDLTVSIDITNQNYQAFLDRYSKTLRRSFRADIVRIYVTDPSDYASLSPEASSGREGFIPKSKWNSIASGVFKSSKGILKEVQLNDSGSSAKPDNCFIMGTIIPSREGHLGVVITARYLLKDPFTPRDLKLMGLFAAQAGNQIVNYRLAEDLRNNASQLEQINVITGRFASSLDSNKVLSSIGQGISSIIPFDLFGLFLVDNTSLPINYILSRSDFPEDLLNAELRTKLEERFGRHMVSMAVEQGVYETFESSVPADWDSRGQLHILDLGRLDPFEGVIIIGSWSHQTDILEGKQKFMPIICRQAAAALDNAQLHEISHKNYIQTIAALAQAVDAKDEYTHYHSRNVTAYSLALADHLCLPDQDRQLLWNAALLHDIGKIGIPEAILNKPGRLTEEEYTILKTHPVKGCTILEPVTAFRELLNGIRHHHERWDGKGYPDGLTNERIPFHARILAIADAFDAMLSDRIYRKSPGLEYAQNQIRDNAGTQFDPYLADAFLDVLKRISPEAILGNYITEITNTALLRG